MKGLEQIRADEAAFAKAARARRPPRRPGRPPLPRGQAATERIELRVTPAQRKEWTAAAERAGLTLKAWIVQRLSEREL